MQESVDDIMKFRKEFYTYKETKENEIIELDEKYGKLTQETHTSVKEFKETITINVGTMLKDLQDIKLQMTANSMKSGNSGAQVVTIEAEVR